ncbi:hypothetical protein BC828DRAFT_380126, partial [Blastocladiella britannica]
MIQHVVDLVLAAAVAAHDGCDTPGLAAYALVTSDVIHTKSTIMHHGFWFQPGHVSALGSTDLLQWWDDWHRSRGQRMVPHKLCIINACKQENVQVLDWWYAWHKDHGVPFPSCPPMGYWSGLAEASLAEHWDVLEWWKRMHREHGVPFHVEDKAVDRASGDGNISLLDWWWDLHKTDGLPFRYSKWSLALASAHGRMESLDWWWDKHVHHGVTLQYDGAVDQASGAGQLAALQWWWAKSTLTGATIAFHYTQSSVSNAAGHGHTHILDWWWHMHKTHNLEFKYTSRAIVYSTSFGRTNSLDWFWNLSTQEGDVPMKYSRDAFDWSSRHAQLAALDWWKDKVNHGARASWGRVRKNCAMEGYNQVPDATLVWWATHGPTLLPQAFSDQ